MAVRPGGVTDPARRIERIIRWQDRQFQQTWLTALATIRDYWTLDELATLLEAGRFEEAIAGLTRAAEHLGNTAGDLLASAGKDTAAWLSTNALTVTVSFDQTNMRAVQMMQQNRLRLIREFTADQRATLRQVMTRGIAEGLNPRDQARLFRDSVGLTARQEAAVANYRRLLSARQGGLPSLEVLDRQLRDGRFDRAVLSALRRETPLPQSQINNMVSRYQQRYIAYRAETIGRTEALRSAHQGSEEMYQQAFDNGEIDPNAVTRTWMSSRDARVRDSHARLSGQSRKVGESWSSGGGELRYPGDPDAPAEETIQCRCVLTTRIDG